MVNTGFQAWLSNLKRNNWNKIIISHQNWVVTVAIYSVDDNYYTLSELIIVTLQFKMNNLE